jgi:hypothetical protein
VPLATVEEILRLYQEQYGDFNLSHIHEKLREQHRIRLSYPWVKRALQTAGLVKKSRKRAAHRRRRPRRPLPGMLLHLDGSHTWFRITVVTTCWSFSTTPPARSTTRNWSKKNRSTALLFS